jgi:hypothetical protein
MKFIKNNLPLALLSSIAPFLFYGQPNIAQSIIVLAIAGLVGYKYNLEQKEQPDYELIFTNIINENANATTLALTDLENQIKQLREKQGVISLVDNQTERRNSISW